VLVICDTRLAQMGYGRRLLAALPPMRGSSQPRNSTPRWTSCSSTVLQNQKLPALQARTGRSEQEYWGLGGGAGSPQLPPGLVGAAQAMRQ
jgi:hypothetical protein